MFAEEPAAPGFGQHWEATEGGAGGGLRAGPEEAEGDEARTMRTVVAEASSSDLFMAHLRGM